MSRDFKKDISERIILADGAMGTMVYARGVFINTCFDELNLTNPNLVSDIHADYIRAGAELIETNTFGANRYKLGAYGVEDRISKINQAGARIAHKAAAGKDVYVAGSIGPLGKPLQPLGHISREEALEAFREQAEALANDVDLFIIETIPSLEEMKIAIEAVQSVASQPIVANLTYTDEGQTIMGESPEQVVEGLRSYDLCVIGCNCSVGPQPMLETIEHLRPLTELPLAALPNAGAPRMVEGRYIYLSSPEYLAEYAKRFIQSGVSLVGGCCGTTPEHVHRMANAVRALRPVHVEVSQAVATPGSEDTVAETPFAERSKFARALTEEFVISVEIDPPKGLDAARSLEGARLMQEAGVHVINIADGPRASARMSPMALATLIQRSVGIETLLHYCCRDRNLLGMQADLIGAHAVGMHNVLIITGDPPKLGDYPSATAVFDVDSIGLVQIVKNLNNGLDLAGNPLGAATAFAIGVGANPGAMDLDTEVRRFYQKVDAGAEYVLTQPVYEAKLLDEFLSRTKDVDVPVLVGLLPLSSYKNAEFLHNEVPGMQIPDTILERMKRTPAGDAARKLGVEIAREALIECKTLDRVHGAYIMPPFGRYKSVLSIIDGVL